jgi:exonuclease VII small subunit
MQDTIQSQSNTGSDIEPIIMSMGLDLDLGLDPGPGPKNQNGTNVNYDDISLDSIPYNRSFMRNRGTLSQIVISLMDMKQRLSEPMNEYQKGLYPQIQDLCDQIVQNYNQLLHTIDPMDHRVFGFYLNGPRNDGKRKPTNTSHELKSYGVSEFKETIKSLNDRLRHIKNDCMKKNEIQESDSEVYVRIIKFCDQFHHVLVDKLNQWDAFIIQFRETNGKNQNQNQNQNNQMQKYTKRPVIRSIKPIRIIKTNLFLPRGQNYQNIKNVSTNDN